MNITLLVGLPGSGKTHYGKSLGIPFYDDLTQNGGFDVIQEASEIAISDFSLIFKAARSLLSTMLLRLFPGSTIRFVIWSNDPSACLVNIKKRDDGRLISEDYMEVITKMYEYPNYLEGGEAEFKEVYREDVG